MGYQEYRKDAMTCLTWHASGCRICWILGIIFALLGAIAAATEITLGLGAVTWLLLAIAAFVASIPCCIAWAAGLFLHAIEARSTKEK